MSPTRLKQSSLSLSLSLTTIRISIILFNTIQYSIVYSYEIHKKQELHFWIRGGRHNNRYIILLHAWTRVRHTETVNAVAVSSAGYKNAYGDVKIIFIYVIVIFFFIFRNFAKKYYRSHKRRMKK